MKYSEHIAIVMAVVISAIGGIMIGSTFSNCDSTINMSANHPLQLPMMSLSGNNTFDIGMAPREQNRSVNATLLTTILSDNEEELPVVMVPNQTDYVMCSDYVKIEDRYKTPEGFYIVVNGTGTITIDNKQYANTAVGEFIRVDNGGYYWGMTASGRVSIMELNTMIGNSSIKLIPVTEAESGYRSACKIVS